MRTAWSFKRGRWRFRSWRPRAIINTTTEVGDVPVYQSATVAQNQTWGAHLQVVQTIYQGGQIRSALRSAKLTKEQALLNYQTVIADALLNVRVAYYDVLSAAEQVVVEEASVKLLTEEVDDQTRRYEAGTVPRFNVLQAGVQLANGAAQAHPRAQHLSRDQERRHW